MVYDRLASEYHIRSCRLISAQHAVIPAWSLATREVHVLYLLQHSVQEMRQSWGACGAFVAAAAAAAAAEAIRMQC